MQAAPRILVLVDQLFWARLTASERDSLSAICRKLLVVDPGEC